MASLMLTSLEDVEIATHSEFGTQYLFHSFSYRGPNDEAWYGTISKKDASDTPTLAEVNQHIRPITEEDNIYPKKPPSFKVAPDLEDVHIKRSGLMSHDKNVPHFCAKVLLHEASIMEQIPAHPNIVTYHGCRVRRGRITGIVLERLENTLMESPHISDIPSFLAELQSAVDHLHSLGLAHNDITPYNIMIKEDSRPVLIDFGACAPPGELVDFLGTPGWREELFFRSEMKHDTYAMGKLRIWLENGGKE